MVVDVVDVDVDVVVDVDVMLMLLMLLLLLLMMLLLFLLLLLLQLLLLNYLTNLLILFFYDSECVSRSICTCLFYLSFAATRIDRRAPVREGFLFLFLFWQTIRQMFVCPFGIIL